MLKDMDQFLVVANVGAVQRLYHFPIDPARQNA